MVIVWLAFGAGGKNIIRPEDSSPVVSKRNRSHSLLFPSYSKEPVELLQRKHTRNKIGGVLHFVWCIAANVHIDWPSHLKRFG